MNQLKLSKPYNPQKIYLQNRNSDLIGRDVSLLNSSLPLWTKATSPPLAP